MLALRFVSVPVLKNGPGYAFHRTFKPKGHRKRLTRPIVQQWSNYYYVTSQTGVVINLLSALIIISIVIIIGTRHIGVIKSDGRILMTFQKYVIQLQLLLR